MEFAKKEINKSISEVMNFFSLAKCVNRNKADGKSTNVMGKPSIKRGFGGGGVYSKFWSSIREFEGKRLDGSCVIVGCDEVNISLCVKSVDQPFLLISANDLNSKDYCKQLGKVMLEPEATLCIGTEGLKKEGSIRLANLLKAASVLFDSRLRLIVFGQEGVRSDIDKYLETHFVMEKLSELSKKVKLDEALESEFSQHFRSELNEALERIKLMQSEEQLLKEQNLKLTSKLDAKADEMSDLKLEIEKLDRNLTDKKEELDRVKGELGRSRDDLEVAMNDQNGMKTDILDLKTKLKNLQNSSEQKCKIAENQVEKVTAELGELKKDYKRNSESDCKLITELKFKTEEDNVNYEKKINELKLEVGELKKKNQAHPVPNLDGSTSSSIDQQTQTKNVVISPTPLSVIKDSLDRNRSSTSSASDLVYKSIRDLKCAVSYVYSGANVRCEVEITRGKNILKYPQLTHFAGEGACELESKSAAFQNFILSVSGFSD